MLDAGSSRQCATKPAIGSHGCKEVHGTSVSIVLPVFGQYVEQIGGSNNPPMTFFISIDDNFFISYLFSLNKL